VEERREKTHAAAALPPFHPTMAVAVYPVRRRRRRRWCPTPRSPRQDPPGRGPARFDRRCTRIRVNTLGAHSISRTRRTWIYADERSKTINFSTVPILILRLPNAAFVNIISFFLNFYFFVFGVIAVVVVLSIIYSR